MPHAIQLAPLQSGLDLAETAGIRERAGRNPDDLRKRPLEMKAAQPDAAGKGAKRMALFRIRPDDVARLLNLFNL